MEPSVVCRQGVDRGNDFEVRLRGASLSYGASQAPFRFMSRDSGLTLQWTRTGGSSEEMAAEIDGAWKLICDWIARKEGLVYFEIKVATDKGYRQLWDAHVLGEHVDYGLRPPEVFKRILAPQDPRQELQSLSFARRPIISGDLSPPPAWLSTIGAMLQRLTTTPQDLEQIFQSSELSGVAEIQKIFDEVQNISKHRLTQWAQVLVNHEQKGMVGSLAQPIETDLPGKKGKDISVSIVSWTMSVRS